MRVLILIRFLGVTVDDASHLLMEADAGSNPNPNPNPNPNSNPVSGSEEAHAKLEEHQAFMLMTQHGLSREKAVDLVHRAVVQHDRSALAEIQGYRQERKQRQRQNRGIIWRLLSPQIYVYYFLVASIAVNYMQYRGYNGMYMYPDDMQSGTTSGIAAFVRRVSAHWHGYFA